MSVKTSAAKRPSAFSRARDYNRAVREAYDIGFRDGYAAYDSLPNVRGARSSAKYGYGRGLSAHRKVNKYQIKARGGR